MAFRRRRDTGAEVGRARAALCARRATSDAAAAARVRRRRAAACVVRPRRSATAVKVILQII